MTFNNKEVTNVRRRGDWGIKSFELLLTTAAANSADRLKLYIARGLRVHTSNKVPSL